MCQAELSRFEESIRREEAMARGMEEASASSIEEQFEQLIQQATSKMSRRGWPG